MRKVSALSILIATAAVVVVGLAGPANAGQFYQEWPDDEDYRASHDFIPQASSIKPVGMACGGKAARFSMQIKKTSSQSVVWQLSARSANDTWYDNYGTKAVNWGQAYYMTHTSYLSNGMHGDSGCQGVGALW